LIKLTEKYPVEFYFLINRIRKWGGTSYFSGEARPMPKNLHWVSTYEPGKYDLAILHIDAQCTLDSIGKGKLYRALNNLITDIPKIVINHSTPMIPEYGYDEKMTMLGGKIIKGGEIRRIYGIREMVGDNFMIVNSYEAHERHNNWGYPIIHGLDPAEWWDLPKEPRVVTVLSAGGFDRYYNRELLEYVKQQLMERYAIKLFQTSVDYKAKDWNDYREFLGSSLIHFYPGLDSPMPRGRTEAMMSGCCSITTKYHGADQFTFTGINGFIVPDNPLIISELIAKLLYEDFAYAEQIGQMGKISAQSIFNIDRWHNTWWEVINMVKDNGSKRAYEILNKKWRKYEVLEPAKKLAEIKFLEKA